MSDKRKSLQYLQALCTKIEHVRNHRKKNVVTESRTCFPKCRASKDVLIGHFQDAGWFDWLYAENETVAAVESDAKGSKRWFTYLCVRYVWDSEECPELNPWGFIGVAGGG